MVIRTNYQDKLLAERLEKKDKELKLRIVKYIKPGRIVEFGCGSGAVLATLSEQFDDSIIVGIDVSESMLDLVNKRKLRNIVPIRANATHRIFAENTFDTAIFVFTLHEIYSFEGKDRLLDALSNAYQILRKNGALIIADSIKPEPRQVKIKFKNKATEEKFRRFIKEFSPRRIDCIIRAKQIELDIADCLDFLTKYKHSDWRTEMKETHFFVTLAELKQILGGIGFKIEKIAEQTEQKDYWEKKLRDAEVDFELLKTPKAYIIVAKKG